MIDIRRLRIPEDRFACKKPPEHYRVLRCTQNLHRSTAQGNVFKRGRTYVVHPDPLARAVNLVYVIDETGRPFSFAREELSESDRTLYKLRDYFDVDGFGSTPGV